MLSDDIAIHCDTTERLHPVAYMNHSKLFPAGHPAGERTKHGGIEIKWQK